MSLTALLLYFRESTNPFVEQAIQFSVAAAKSIITDKDKKDAIDKLLLQGCKTSLIYFCCSQSLHRLHA
jgi:phosphomevalonate kinase